MCFISKKRIKKLEDSIKKLTTIIENDELRKLRNVEIVHNYEQKRIDTIRNNILRLKSVKIDDEHELVKIVYETPTIYLKIDEQGLPEEDKLFKAINELNLVSSEDCNKIREALEKVKKKY